MRKALLCFSAVSLALVGCGGATTSFVKSETTTLGRVVVYRNGVAYFERTARVDDDKLTLAVPADKVDDFLKSLSVVDALTGEPTPVVVPDHARRGDGGHGPHRHEDRPARQAPPRAAPVVRDRGAGLEAELPRRARRREEGRPRSAGPSSTTPRARTGRTCASASARARRCRSGSTFARCASSSARRCSPTILFAIAPPTGDATYGGPPIVANKVLGDIGDEGLKEDDGKDASGNARFTDDPMSGAFAGGMAQGAGASGGRPAAAATATAPHAAPPPPRTKPRPDALAAIAKKLQQERGTITIEGYAAPADLDKQAASLDRANRLRQALTEQRRRRQPPRRGRQGRAGGQGRRRSHPRGRGTDRGSPRRRPAATRPPTRRPARRSIPSARRTSSRVSR